MYPVWRETDASSFDHMFNITIILLTGLSGLPKFHSRQKF